MMKRRPIFLLFLALSAAGCLRGQHPPRQQGIDPLHYTFTIQLPDSGRTIDGRAVVTIRRSGDADHLVLDLADLKVDTVRVSDRPVKFVRKPRLIDIPLPRPGPAAIDTLDIAVRYGGEVKDGLIIHADEKGRWYAFGDNWPDRASCWLPTIDDPSAKATVSWNILAPSTSTVVANGALLGQEVLPFDSRRGSVSYTLTRWNTARPIPPYLMVIAAGPLTKYDLGLTARGLSEFPPGVRQSVYVVPELTDYLPGPFASAGAIVQFFSTLVAPFPYEKLAHVQSFTRYGGMENASAIFYANDLFKRKEMHTGIIAHETAHQWFGDAVTPRSWGHLWLSEGFATYFEQLWVEKSEGEKPFQRGMRQLRDEIAASDVTYMRPVIDTLQDNYGKLLNTNSYQKGAWALHMLRSLLGDSVFFAGIRRYYDQHRHGTATSDDLCASLEQVSHRRLRWYFDEWLRRPGIPEFTVRWTYDQELSKLSLVIEQDSRTPPYQFPLAIEVQALRGESKTVTVEVPATRTAHLSVPVDLITKPVRLFFDPQVRLLAIIKTK